MTFRDFFAALARKPWVALTVAVLCAIWGLREITAPPLYEARCVVTLLSPPSTYARNAYASFTPSLVLMAKVTAETMDSPDGLRAVRRAGGSGDYQVLLANRGSQEVPIYDQPYLWVSATSRDSREAKSTREAVLQVLHAELRRRQDVEGAEPTSFISWRVTGSTSEPVALSGRTSRQLLAFLVLGVLGTCYAVVTADRHGLRLPRRRRALPGRRLRESV